VAHCELVAGLHMRYLAVGFKSPEEELLFLTAFVQLGPNGSGACEGATVGGGLPWGRSSPLTRPKEEGCQLSPEGFVRGLSQ